jgi:hypothetical protein
VSTYPGCNVLTRIGARSIASERAKASTAPHDAVATAAPRSGRRAVVPDMNVIDPPAFILAAPYLAALNAPQKTDVHRGSQRRTVRSEPRIERHAAGRDEYVIDAVELLKQCAGTGFVGDIERE